MLATRGGLAGPARAPALHSPASPRRRAGAPPPPRAAPSDGPSFSGGGGPGGGGGGGGFGDPDASSVAWKKAARSQKGASFERTNRRKGRPAWRRSPDDSPLRDGNRDRLIGFLTERAARTLVYYYSELDPVKSSWLLAFMRAFPIPRDDGNWEDISGATFLRKLLSMPVGAANVSPKRAAVYEMNRRAGINPREVAASILSIRTQLAAEFAEDLADVAEENALLMREAAAAAMAKTLASMESSDEDGGLGGGWASDGLSSGEE